MPHSWNLSEWLNALGLRRRDQPDLIHAVQPVEIMGNHSLFSAQILPATLYSGGQRTAVAAQYAILKVHCLSPGGLWIRNCEVGTGQISNHQWHVVSGSGSTLGNTVAVTQMNVGAVNALSTVELGTNAAAPAVQATHPFLPLQAAMTFSVRDVFVPPNWTFETWTVHVNRVLAGWIQLEECHAQRSER